MKARGAAGCASYLDALGLLAPDVVVAHATYLTDAEADLVGARRTAVAHCPSSNAKLEGRVAPIARMRRAGAVVGLGTDAACCNNGMDLFDEMKVAGLLNKVAADDPAALPALDILRAATSEAARALGIDHLVGTLEPGKRADVIAVRTRGAHLRPWHDPVANLVYAARGLGRGGRLRRRPAARARRSARGARRRAHSGRRDAGRAGARRCPGLSGFAACPRSSSTSTRPAPCVPRPSANSSPSMACRRRWASATRLPRRARGCRPISRGSPRGTRR